MIKHSRQRDAVYENLLSRKDHPTAEEVFFELKKTNPSISLATVYRNLSFLKENGSIIGIPGEVERFDADISPHCHLVCFRCGGVSDIYLGDLHELDEAAEKKSGEKILSHSVCFRGLCTKCATEAE